MDYSIRLLRQDDEPLLWKMLYEAAHLGEGSMVSLLEVTNCSTSVTFISNLKTLSNYLF
jgi:hypothetical protein